MKNLKSLWAVAVASAILMNAATLTAADAKTYQVTGPVLEVTPTTITVQKGDDKWQISRDKGTRMSGSGELKVGAKVTIYYRMVATEVEVKTGGDSQKKPAK